MTHASLCNCGGQTIKCHDEVKISLFKMFNQLAFNARMEVVLDNTSKKRMDIVISNIGDSSEISADVYTCYDNLAIDVTIINVNSSNGNLDYDAAHKLKDIKYTSICNSLDMNFKPMVFSSNGNKSKATSTLLKWLINKGTNNLNYNNEQAAKYYRYWNSKIIFTILKGQAYKILSKFNNKNMINSVQEIEDLGLINLFHSNVQKYQMNDID